MPAKWFECQDGRKIEIQACLNGKCRMKNRCADRSYLQLVSREREWTGTPSTTQLISGTMYAFLKLTKDYAIYPGDRAFMVHGTKGHAILEGMDDECSFLEERLQLEEGITGIADAIEVEDGITTLWDRKTSGSYRVMRAIGLFQYDHPTSEVFKTGPRKGQPKTVKMFSQRDDMKDTWDWDLQLNLYRIMFERIYGHVDKLKIMCVVRDGGTWIAFNRGIYDNTYVIPIKILDDKIILDYFEEKRRNLLQALDKGEWQIPCNEHENWGGLKCDRYCDVSMFCPLGIERQKEKENEMPIRKLGQRWQLAGNIRLGVKLTNKEGKEYPKEVDYFILDPNTPNAKTREQLLAEFNKEYGDEPKSIDIMFPGDSLDTIFPQWYKRYGSSTLLQCQGDGMDAAGNPGTAVCMSEDFTKGLKVTGTNASGLPIVECWGDNCPYVKSHKCNEIAVLNVLLPKISSLGIWRITTGSINSILNLNNTIELVREILRKAQIFSLAGVPLKLERVPQEIAHEGKKTTHFILQLVPGWKIDAIMKARDMRELSTVLDTRLALPEAEVRYEDTILDKALPPASDIEPEIPIPATPPKDIKKEQFDSWLEQIAKTTTEIELNAIYNANKKAINEHPAKETILDEFKSKKAEIKNNASPVEGGQKDGTATPVPEATSTTEDAVDDIADAKLELKTLVIEYKLDHDGFNSQIAKQVGVESIDAIKTMDQVDKVRIILAELNPNQPALC